MSSARIIGTGQTHMGKLGKTASELMQAALKAALIDASIPLSSVDGLVAMPSFSHTRFMEAHCFATEIGLVPKKNTLLKTVTVCEYVSLPHECECFTSFSFLTWSMLLCISAHDHRWSWPCVGIDHGR